MRGALSPTRSHFAFLQRAQQLDLERLRKLPELVEEERAAVRLLEESAAVLGRAR